MNFDRMFNVDKLNQLQQRWALINQIVWHHISVRFLFFRLTKTDINQPALMSKQLSHQPTQCQMNYSKNLKECENAVYMYRLTLRCVNCCHVCMYLQRFENEEWWQETDNAGDEPHQSHALAEAPPQPHW